METTLTRMCLHPLQDKVNDLLAMAKDIRDELESSLANGVETRKVFRKYRSELFRVYKLYQELEGKAESDSDSSMLKAFLDGLEKDSQAAHEKCGFTYTSLSELAALE